jgi:hypothetical protein
LIKFPLAGVMISKKRTNVISCVIDSVAVDRIPSDQLRDDVER